MTEGTETECRYRLSLEEYASALRLYYSHTLHTKTDVIGGALGLVGGVFLYTTGNVAVGIFLLCASAFLLGVLLIGYFVMPPIFYRQEPKFRDEYWLRFTEDGIDFKTEHIDSRIDWTFYNKVYENDRVYLLVYGKRAFSTIPRRAFPSPDHEARFRDLLKRKIIERDS
jgi:hypothetical protein